MAPSRVPWLFPGDISANKRVFIMRGEREGYVVECCVSNVERVSDAVVLKWVALLGGNDEWRRTESMGGRI